MSKSSAHFRPSPAHDSAAARQLQQGYPWLRFSDATLEQDFRENHHRHSRRLVSLYLGIFALLVLALVAVDQWVLHRADNVLLKAIQYSAFFTLMVSVAIAVTENRFTRYYPLVVQCLATSLSMFVVGYELIDRPSGIPTIVLTIFSLYLFVGMRFVIALCLGVSVMVAYLAGMKLMQLPAPELIYDSCVLLLANVVGATAAYMLENLQRTAFLEARLLTEMANRDGLTGIHNRRAFDERLHLLWEQAIREQQSIALLLIDIDHFKAFNDCFGHQAGDHCLKKVAETIATATRRPLDMSARYGGEEFAVLLYDVNRKHVEQVTANIQAALKQLGLSNPVSIPEPHLTVSIGVACVVPHKSRTSYGVVQLADEALYAAKEAGRNQVVIRDVEYADLTTGAFRNANNLIRRLG